MYSEEELKEIVKTSESMTEVIQKLGYKTSHGKNPITIRKRIDKYNISTKHFKSNNISRHKTKDEDIFCKNSKVAQAVLRRRYKEISNYSECSICGQLKTWNNKDLTMILDHIDGDNHNNIIENLRWICPNCNSQLDTFAGRNIKKYKKKDINKNKKICQICNKNYIDKKSNMCLECYEKERAKNIPSKEELEKYIYDTPFVKIGEIFGVSDNAVRKWCKKYGLPYKYKDLHKSNA